MQEQTDDLGHLLAAYRNAVPDPEPSVGFTPALWRRIEAQRRETTVVSLFARRILAFGSALSLATVLLVIVPDMTSVNSPAVTSTYVDELERQGTPDADPLQTETI